MAAQEQEQAQGMLVAALGLLAAHYGFSEANSGCCARCRIDDGRTPSMGLARG